MIIGPMAMLGFSISDPRVISGDEGLDLKVIARGDGRGLGTKVGFGDVDTSVGEISLAGRNVVSGAAIVVERSEQLSAPQDADLQDPFYPGFVWIPELGVYELTVTTADGARWSERVAFCEIVPGIII